MAVGVGLGEFIDRGVMDGFGVVVDVETLTSVVGMGSVFSSAKLHAARKRIIITDPIIKGNFTILLFFISQDRP